MEQCIGGNNRARTYDPLLVRQMLSQLSYAPNNSVCITARFIISQQLLFVNTFFVFFINFFVFFTTPENQHKVGVFSFAFCRLCPKFHSCSFGCQFSSSFFFSSASFFASSLSFSMSAPSKLYTLSQK